ncbi:hypothetical protein M9434_001960 [Picochlorum sp. BPE23]|nr:hypothetical protein M9434_001960 [Picochlorum sp. BPE23]
MVCDRCSIRPTCGRPWSSKQQGNGLKANRRNVALHMCSARTDNVMATVSPSDIEDPWLAQVASVAFDGTQSPAMEGLNDVCASAVKSLRVPTTRNEEYRFTDLSCLTGLDACVPETPTEDMVTEIASKSVLKCDSIRIVLVNGQVHAVDTGAIQLPSDVYVGPVANAPRDILKFSLGAQSKTRGGPFATLNGASAKDCAVIYVPEDCNLEAPIHIINISSGGKDGNTIAFSSPRTLVFLESGASAQLVEEYVTLNDSGNGTYASIPVTEIELDDNASLSHKFVELEDENAINLKCTLVSQGTESSYSLIEVRLGGKLSRHDASIVQLGERTSTEMKHFILAGEDQLHDLHTKLALDHPEGTADQIHKCIAATDSSKGVFDGNVKVNRMAQRTDAGQLSKNLLLAPKATVNVKPNLQIIADDVKCTHGCTVSDLEEEQLFYLQARGIDPMTARKMLVYSFGGEVIQRLEDPSLTDRVQEQATESLNKVFN